MIDHLANLLALRNIITSLTVVSTGTGEFGSNAYGFTRGSGSFIVDGFVVGMEVTPFGFTNDAPAIVTAVTAGQLMVSGGRTPEPQEPEKYLVCAFPGIVQWEGTQLSDEQLADLVRRWSAEEDYVPGPVRGETFCRPGGFLEGDPMYVVRIYAPGGTGAAAMYKMADALLRLFPPNDAIVLPGGDVLRVRSDTAPYRGQMTTRTGRSLVVVTIPLRIRAVNTP
jgi:hypothetical protein